MANLPVKWFSTDMAGSTDLTTALGTLGLFNDWLTQSLVEGFNINAPTNVTYDGVSGDVTMTFAAAHGYLDLCVIEVSGADQNQYNGEFRITVVDELTLTYTPDTAPAISPATGSIFVKVAPAGWNIVEEDAANYIKAYGRPAIDATEYVLVVHNGEQFDPQPGVSNGHYVKVVVADNFVNLENYETVHTFYWPASHAFAYRQSYFIADPKMFFFGLRFAWYDRMSWYFFGDINPIKPGDQGCCTWMEAEWRADNQGEWDTSSGEYVYSNLPVNDSTSYRYIATQWHNAPGVASFKTIGFEQGNHGDTVVFPNPANNSWIVCMHQLPILESATVGTVLRGFMPGIVETLNVATSMRYKLHTQVPGYEDSPLIVLPATYTAGANLGEISIVFSLGNWREQVG